MNTSLKQLLTVGAWLAVAATTQGTTLSLDGTNDYAFVQRVGLVAQGNYQVSFLAQGNWPHTIEAWVKPRTLPSARAGLMVLGSVVQGSHHWLFLPNGQMQMGPGNGGAYQLNPVVPVGLWTHLAAVSDGTNYSVYTNGVLVGTTTNTSPSGHFDLQGIQLTLGLPIVGGESYFPGAIDELRIWNTARSQAAIQQNFNRRLLGTESGLVAYYPFEEGSGPTAHDATAHHVDAFLSNPFSFDDHEWNTLDDALAVPLVATLVATNVSFGNATLNGIVNGGSLPTTAWFEYGTQVAAVPGSADNQVWFFNIPDYVTSFNQMDFTVTPIWVQSFTNIDVGNTTGPFFAGGPTDHFAARYTGRIYLPASGTYTFYLLSDDGSQLFIDNQKLVDNNGPSPFEASGSAYLPAGHHLFEVRYFDFTAGAQLNFYYSGPSISKQIIPPEAFLRHDPIYTASTPVQNLPANALPVPLTAGLTNLSGNTIYYFHLVATNASGISRGTDQTFTVLNPGALTTLNFDGVNDEVIVSSAATNGLRVTTNATWEAWINPTGPGSQPTEGGIILNKEGEYEIARFADGTIRYAVAITTAAAANWSWINTGFVAPLNAWTHIALTYDGSLFRFYTNGSLAHTNARTGGSPGIGDLFPASNNFYIGGRALAVQFFNGMIDEVRVWGTVRSQADIQQYSTRNLTGTEPGLLAYYRFDEGSGVIVHDSGPNSGPNGFDGTVSGGAGWVASGAPLFQPLVSTLPAAPVLATTATLRGTVNPSGPNTVAYFEYGETIAYGTQTVSQVVGTGIATLPFSAGVSNLQPGTLYHLRIVAFNSSNTNTVIGADQTFTTLVLGCGWPISSAVNNGKAFAPKHVVDADGNAYVAGLFTGTASFKNTLQPQGGSGTNAFVGKLSRGADWLWAANIPISSSGALAINALAVDGARNVYVAGQFIGTATFGTNVLVSAGTGSDLFVAKLSSAGTAWLWARSTGGSNQFDSANALGVTSAGAVFVAGHFGGTAAFGTNNLSSVGGSQDIFVAKLDTDGNWLWARAAGGSGTNDTALALALNGAEDVYIGGSFQGTNASFGNTTLNGGTNSDLFVARLNTSGTWLLAARAGGSGPDTATALTIDAAGQVYLLGQFTGTADYNQTVTNLNLNADGGARLFVAKLNPNATMLWYAQAGAGYSDSIAVDNAGRVYISGEFTISTQFGDPAAFTLVSAGNSDVFVAQLATDSGTWNWAKRIGSTGSETRGSVGVDGDGGVVISGSYQNTIQIGYVLLTSPNERDIFVARMTPDQVFEHNNFVIGQPIPVPAEAQDPSRTDGGAYRQPDITILEKVQSDSDALNSFVWSLSEQKLFAVRPVTAAFKWALSSDLTNTTKVATCVGRSVWPAQPQFHVANAPVELEPAVPGFPLRFFNLAYTTVNGAAVDATTKSFTAPTNGWSVLQFLNTGGASPNPSSHPSLFEVVRTVSWNDPAHLTDTNAVIGEVLTHAAHNDPTGKNGYVYFERAFYDGVGDDRAYDRGTRTGPILPVNSDTAAPDDDLVVVWYRTNAVTGIAWPDDPVRYLARWPNSPDELVLASGDGSGLLDPVSFPDKRVYNQPDDSLAGFNPNEEHAALYGDVLYALRNDLNAKIKVSEPYTLLKYHNPANHQWTMKVFKVVTTNATNNFTYSGKAGQELLLPRPLSLLNLCGTSNQIVSGPGFKDYQGRLYARAAGTNLSGASIVARYSYPLQPGFFYDLDRNGQPEASVGTCIPWLDRRPGGTVGQAIDITYNITWPANVPVLQVGESLFGAKFGLPDIRHFANAQVIFDQANPNDTNPLNSLVRLFDPLSERTLDLPASFVLPAAISTANRGGRKVFTDLPYAIRSRLFFDDLNKRLSFGGLLSEDSQYGGPENPLLMINVLSPRERDRIKQLSGDTIFRQAIDDLYDLTRNPNRIDADRDGQPDKALRIGLAYATEPIGSTGLFTTTTNIVPENLGDIPKVLTAGSGTGSGFVTIVENNDPSLGGLPVTLHVIRIDDGPYRGDIKVLYPDNVFDEKLTLRHSGDFGGEPQRFEFEWYHQPDSAGFSRTNLPTVLPNGQIDELNGWIRYTAVPSGTNGFNDITLGDGNESSLLTLADNWFVCRYRGYSVGGQSNVWSDWVGAIGGGQAQLAEGWVKRVVFGLNPFDARTADFHANETVTFASMLQQAGTRYEGDIAFNPDGGNINSIGLIEAYETVLRRARRLSIDGSPAINYQPANDALLLAASRIADFYMLLGNEAFADAADPTIGFRTDSAGYGTLAPSIFTFQNQLDSLLEEEIVLLRGRDDRSATVRSAPVYNRLFWNFTHDDGEVAYAQAYNITDQNHDGFIDASDARIMYPQGHGDAWGHYLTATKSYYSLLQSTNFDWVPRSETIQLAGVPVEVDYLDERKFARAAAAKAKTGAEIVDLTYRLNYVDDPNGQFQGYKDTDASRAWGVSEWGDRVGSAALFDWVLANAILPAIDPNTNHVGIQKIDRTTVTEIDEIVAGYEAVQSRINKADAGLNPVGLVKNVVPFDIDPTQIDAGKTHFEQIYDRAIQAMNNTVTVFNHANQLSQALRAQQDTVNSFSRNVDQQERDYKNRLIEIFGYPYAGDIGSGKIYPSGYDGPDLYHYMYVNTVELNGDTAPPSQTFYGFFTPTKFGLDISPTIGKDFFFPNDAPTYPGDRLATNILMVSYPFSPADYGFTAPAGWGQRRAPGQIQMALSDMVQSQARYKQALLNYDNLILQIQDKTNLLQAKYNLQADKVFIHRTETAALATLSAVAIAAKITSTSFETAKEFVKESTDTAVDGLPKTVGTSSDVFFPARLALGITKNVTEASLTYGKVLADNVAEGAKDAKDAAKDVAEWQIDKAEFKYEIQQQLSELEELFRQEAQLRVEAFAQREALVQSLGKYQTALAEGLRLADERIAFRKNAAAETQQSRYQDMTFRVFRNDAIQKYRAQFDLAAQYVFLAAVAYDYETQLLGGHTGSGREFLTDIIRQRSLGQIENGVPIAGRHGLADPLARLSQNFSVLKGQLGFNNPQTETGRFSLRNELLRLHDSSDAAWRAELKKHVAPNLWDIPEFRRYCRPFAPESAGPQPGLVIRFPTTVTFGLNYFGWPLGGGDSAYDSSLFATKVRSAGVWFSDYNGNGLSLTPRVYLVPVGADVFRSPSGNDLETREWRVVDQKIPVPFPIGFSSLTDPTWIPMNDSLSDTFADIRRFSSFRAYHDSGSFDPSQTISDNRLIGRSVWNTDWMLIIPGGTFLFDPNQGLDTFINSASDIKIFFQTYAYSGN